MTSMPGRDDDRETERQRDRINGDKKTRNQNGKRSQVDDLLSATLQ
jgi:hypothetical protein